MEYLLKISAVIFIFYGFYKLFLQGETFFQINRWYFLTGIIVATFIPLIIIPIYIEQLPISIETLAPLNSQMIITPVISESNLNLWDLLSYAYGLGVIFFLGKLTIELASLKFLFKKHRYYKHESFTFVETEDDTPPFSFFNWIVYNPTKYSHEELSHILNHEKVHAKELHSIDIILIQLAGVLLWFNPFVWLYKRDIQQNLEFIADKKAQNFSDCKKSYQLVLLKSSIPEHKFLITNNFYNSQIKKRIIMLHKSKSNKINAWKYGLILPVLALFLMSFNTKKVFIKTEKPSTQLDQPIHSKTGTKLNEFHDETNLNTTTSNASLQKPKKSGPISNGKNLAQSTTIKSNTKTKIITDISETLVTKNTSDSELDAITYNLKKEGLTIKFKGVKRNLKGEIIAIKIDARSKTSNANYKTNSDDAITSIKIVFDEEKNTISIGNTDNNHKDHTFVYTVTGKKHKTHKSTGGNHVYIISDAEHLPDEEHEEDTQVIINGSATKTIKTNSAEIQVISEIEANGKVEIIMDSDNYDKDIIIMNEKGKKVRVIEDDEYEDIMVLKKSDRKNKIFITDNKNTNPLLIIDGSEVNKKDLVNMSADSIESVTVLKNKSANVKYGDKGKDGVIIIKTKKKN